MTRVESAAFIVMAYHELRSPEPDNTFQIPASADWAFDYPSERVWKLRKR